MESVRFHNLCWCFKAVLLAGAILLPATDAHGAERSVFYRGVRQMGMGGAAVAVVNDETALLLNPAGLGKLRDYIITLADPEVEGGSNFLQLAGLDVIDMMKPQPMLDKLSKPSHQGERLHLKGQVFPSIVVPNFGFGVYGGYSADGKVDETGSNFEYNYRNDFAGVLGLNFRLFSGTVKVGASMRAINRVEISRDDLPVPSSGLTVNSLASEGAGVAADAGLIITLPVAALPTIAAVWRDVGSTSYSMQKGMFTSAVTIPSHTPESVDVGLAFFPILGKRTRASFTLEYRDVLTMSEEKDHMRRSHGGVELNVADTFFLRAGMNQRYWTAGLEFATGNYQLQAASYGEEVGTVDKREEDRRYALKFSLRF